MARVTRKDPELIRRTVVLQVFSPDKFRGIVAKRNVKMAHLATFLGVTPQTVSTYSQGASTPDANSFMRILAYLDINDLDEITDAHEEEIETPDTEVFAP